MSSQHDRQMSWALRCWLQSGKKPTRQITRELLCWIYGDKCPTCGRVITPRKIEPHHRDSAAYRRKPHERPDDLIGLCSACHAVITYSRRHGAYIRKIAFSFNERGDQIRVDVEDVHECAMAQRDEIIRGLDELREKADRLLALSRAAREWEEWEEWENRRAA